MQVPLLVIISDRGAMTGKDVMLLWGRNIILGKEILNVYSKKRK